MFCKRIFEVESSDSCAHERQGFCSRVWTPPLMSVNMRNLGRTIFLIFRIVYLSNLVVRYAVVR